MNTQSSTQCLLLNVSAKATWSNEIVFMYLDDNKRSQFFLINWRLSLTEITILLLPGCDVTTDLIAQIHNLEVSFSRPQISNIIASISAQSIFRAVNVKWTSTREKLTLLHAYNKGADETVHFRAV